jgi:uncharacterized protein (TIGR00251 family)
MSDISGALSEDRHGTVIAIEVTAGAKEAVFPSGYNEWRQSIGCRIPAPALEGRANKAVLSLIAGKLDVPASSVSIVSGAASSQKRVFVAGIGKQDLLGRLGSLL